MTKKTFVLIIALVFLLAACSIGGDGNTNEPNNDQETTNNQNDQNAETPEDPVYSPAASVAVCTAASEPVEITLDQFDHVKGAVEDYKVTLIEYGDFQ